MFYVSYHMLDHLQGCHFFQLPERCKSLQIGNIRAIDIHTVHTHDSLPKCGAHYDQEYIRDKSVQPRTSRV